MKLSPHQQLAAAILLSLTVCGCGGSDRPKTYPVSGKVTLNGDAVEGAEVSFFSDASPRAARGTTDAEGKYQLTTFDTNDGAIEGEFSVTIGKIQAKDSVSEMDPSDPSAGYGAAMDAAAKGQTDDMQTNELPKKYADRETSGLKRTVVAGDSNEFNFELQ